MKHFVFIICCLIFFAFSYSIFELPHVMTSIASSDPKLFLELFLSAVNQATMTFAKSIQKNMEKGDYTNKQFIIAYDEYNKNLGILKRALRYVSEYLMTFDNKYLTTIYANYLFYTNVINKQYTYKKQQKWLYEIFVDATAVDSIQEFFLLFKMHTFFYMFSLSAKDKRDLYFNQNLDSLMTTSDKFATPEFLETIMIDIDSSIRSLGKFDTKNEDAVKTASKKVIDNIKMCMRIGDKTYFMVSYLKFLQNRLINHCVPPEIENEFMKTIRYNDSPELFVKMKYCIQDMALSHSLTHEISTIPISAKSKKYENFDVRRINLQSCKYNVIRQYSWKDGKCGKFTNHGRLNEPLAISCYFDILNNYVTNVGNELLDGFSNCVLVPDYDNSTGVIEMTFADKTYKFNATLMQIIVLKMINDAGNITAQNLATTLGISLKPLTSVFNSLIKTGLIVRDKKTQSNDTNMRFELNTEWSCADDKICLVTELERLKNPKVVAPTAEKPVNDGFIRAMILSFIVDSGSSGVTFEKLCAHVVANKADVSRDKIALLLIKLVDGDLVEFDGKTYRYPADDDSESDSDDKCADVMTASSVVVDVVPDVVAEVAPNVVADVVPNVVPNVVADVVTADTDVADVVAKSKLVDKVAVESEDESEDDAESEDESEDESETDDESESDEKPKIDTTESESSENSQDTVSNSSETQSSDESKNMATIEKVANQILTRIDDIKKFQMSESSESEEEVVKPKMMSIKSPSKIGSPHPTKKLSHVMVANDETSESEDSPIEIGKTSAVQKAPAKHYTTNTSVTKPPAKKPVYRGKASRRGK